MRHQATTLPSSLAALARELRDATVHENWDIDWTQFHTQMDHAAAACQSGDFAQGIRQYGQSISFIMSELKRLGRDAGRH